MLLRWRISLKYWHISKIPHNTKCSLLGQHSISYISVMIILGYRNVISMSFYSNLLNVVFQRVIKQNIKVTGQKLIQNLFLTSSLFCAIT